MILPACRRACAWTPRRAWLARYFTAEYAGHFDIFLPRLAAFGLPLPLGGSSNHFRTATLREVGGWDPYNVTEDADLGMRLARFGYRCGVIDSTTFEEAPATVAVGLASAHAGSKAGCRHGSCICANRGQLFQRPRALAAFSLFKLIVGGNALVALAHPVFVVRAGLGAGRADISGQVRQRQSHLMAVLSGKPPHSVIAFRRISAGSDWRTAAYRQEVPHSSLDTGALAAALSGRMVGAACRIIMRLFRWKKTEHGLDKTDRPREHNSSTGRARAPSHRTRKKRRAAPDMGRRYR